MPSDFEEMSEPIKLLEAPKITEKVDKVQEIPIRPISQGTLSYTEIYQERLKIVSN